MIEEVEADEYYFVSHANYQELGYIPPILNKKITHFIGVSDFASKQLDKIGEELGRKTNTQTCYNPLTLEPKEKVINIVSAGRLNDKVKGGERTLKLIRALDKYCEKTGRHYIWHIFTNPISINIDSPNVALMKPRVDVRPYIAEADYVVQLSNDMETYCYTINEALGYGVPIITTPLSILKELPITDNEHLVLEYDCSNISDIVKQIFEKEVNKFKYIPPKDTWEEFLIKEKSSYEEEKKMKFLVEATDKYVAKRTWDVELSKKKSEELGKDIKYYPKKGEQWEVSFERKELLVENGFVIVIKEISDKSKKVKTNKKKVA